MINGMSRNWHCEAMARHEMKGYRVNIQKISHVSNGFCLLENEALSASRNSIRVEA